MCSASALHLFLSIAILVPVHANVINNNRNVTNTPWFRQNHNNTIIPVFKQQLNVNNIVNETVNVNDDIREKLNIHNDTKRGFLDSKFFPMKHFVVFGDFIEDTVKILVMDGVVNNMSHLFKIVEDASLKLNEESVTKSVNVFFKKIVNLVSTSQAKSGDKTQDTMLKIIEKLISVLKRIVRSRSTDEERKLSNFNDKSSVINLSSFFNTTLNLFSLNDLNSRHENITQNLEILLKNMLSKLQDVNVRTRLFQTLANFGKSIVSTEFKVEIDSFFKKLLRPKSTRQAAATLSKKVYNRLRNLVNNFDRALFKFVTNASSVHVELSKRNANVVRSMKMSVSRLLQILLLPALVMTGIMPFVLPPLKMAVMMSTTITNMAFMSALGTLVRNYIFEPDLSKIVRYKNHGWKEDRRKEVMYRHRK